ncbi:PPC domain-containing protein [Isosphaeraceae bacterium EP7]
MTNTRRPARPRLKTNERLETPPERTTGGPPSTDDAGRPRQAPMTMLRRPARIPAAALLLLLLTAQAEPARAAAPSLTSMAPRGLERGKTVAFTLNGDGIGGAGVEVRTSLPGTLGPVEVVGPNQIKVSATVPGDAPVGFYTVQARTADGLTAPLTLAVGDLPEVAEAEPNDIPGSAQALTLPATVQGACAGTDRDFVKFAAKKGQAIVLEVEARRLGSGLDSAITVTDAAGLTLSMDTDSVPVGGDTRLVFVPPADGTYLAVLNDIKFGGANDPFYRWKIGNYAAADAVYPLGWRRGEWVEAQWLGGSLPSPLRLKVQAPADTEVTSSPLTLPASGPMGASPLRMVVSDLPERLEPDAKGPHALAVGTVMNGRIAAAGETDAYFIPVKPGQVLTLGIEASRLGSRLDAVLVARKPDGSVLAQSDEGGMDPSLALTIPEGVSEINVSVTDLLGRGGPSFAYRLLARPATPDFELRVNVPAINIPKGSPVVIPVQVVRRGFNDAIQLSVSGDLAASGVVATGGLIPAGASEGSILLSAAPDTEPKALALELWGTAGSASQPIRRRARSTTDGTPGGPQKPFLLAAAVGTGPTITLAASAPSIVFVHGQKSRVVVSAKRPAGNKEPIALSVTGLPAQVTGGTATIGPDQTEATLEFDVAAVAPVVDASVGLVAKYKAGGRDETVTLAPLSGRVVRPYSVEVLTPEVKAAPGSRAAIALIVRRVPPFDGPVHLSVEGSVPPQVIILPVVVPAGQALAQVEVTVGPAAPAGSLDLLVRAAADMPGRKQTKDYQIPDVPVRITVTPPPAVPVAAQ